MHPVAKPTYVNTQLGNVFIDREASPFRFTGALLLSKSGVVKGFRKAQKVREWSGDFVGGQGILAEVIREFLF